MFNWIGTMWGGRLTFPTPMLWAVGFLYLFLTGGLTGVILGSPPLDFALHDTYYVVAHFHGVLVGGTVFALFAAIYFWFPKMTGRRLSEALGKLHFWSWLIGFTLTFFVQYQLGADGMMRRYADYPSDAGWTTLNYTELIPGQDQTKSISFTTDSSKTVTEDIWLVFPTDTPERNLRAVRYALDSGSV